MTKSLSHTRTDRAIDRFLEISRLSHEAGVVRQLIEDKEFHGGTIEIDGSTVANFGLCSYLGLGDDQRLIDAAKDAIDRYGNSYSSSLAYTGLGLYGELREKMATILGAPVVIAPTTTLAHHAALPVLVRAGDTVLVDGQAHASLLSVMPVLQGNGAVVEQVGHNDIEAVGDRASSTTGRVWYVCDGLYSMNGDTAPAEDIYSLLDAAPNVWVYCDDAHGLGWSGARGQGQFLDRVGWHERLVMSFGLAKSFGSMGGVVATPDESLVEAIEITGGPLVFGGPLPPGVLAANIASADIHLSNELPSLQAELIERIRFVNDFSSEIGLPLANREETPLWFVELGKSMKVLSSVRALLDRGHYVNGAVFPVVPRGRGGVRFTVTRYNQLDQIEDLLGALREVYGEYEDHDDVVDLTVLEDRPAPSDDR